MDFSNKVVIITGASSGIGAETAKQFAALNAKLVITGRNEENLREVVSASTDLKDFLILVGDLRNERFVTSIVEKTISKFHRIDVLVNNAGIFETGSIITTSLGQYDNLMSINVRALYHLTTIAVPHLIEAKGSIVNVSSVLGLRAAPNLLAYSMSKAAVDQFTRCVALDLKSKGVRVNAVNPGLIKTDLLISGLNTLENSANSESFGRAGTVEEVAKSIIFLASENASFITAVTLPVDGGKQAICPI